MVSAELEYAILPESIGVFDKKTGKEVPSQVVERTGNKLKVLFLADMPSAGVKVYDVRETPGFTKSTGLSITSNTLENV